MADIPRTLRILGTRGVPAAHGGFETFAEYLSLYLVRKGWRVIVYCQEFGNGPLLNDSWQGVERVRIPVRKTSPLGTIIFDWKSVRHAAARGDLCLTLGYNTAVFCALLRIKGYSEHYQHGRDRLDAFPNGGLQPNPGYSPTSDWGAGWAIIWLPTILRSSAICRVVFAPARSR